MAYYYNGDSEPFLILEYKGNRKTDEEYLEKLQASKDNSSEKLNLNFIAQTDIPVKKGYYVQDDQKVLWRQYNISSENSIVEKLSLEDGYEYFSKSVAEYYFLVKDNLISFFVPYDWSEYSQWFYGEYDLCTSFITDVSKPDDNGDYIVTVDNYLPLTASASDFEGKNKGDIVDIKGRKVRLLGFESVSDDSFDTINYSEVFTDATEVVLVEMVDINEFSDVKDIYGDDPEEWYVGEYAYVISDDGIWRAFLDGDLYPNEYYVDILEKTESDIKLKITDATIVALCMDYGKYMGAKHYFDNAEKEDDEYYYSSYRNNQAYVIYPERNGENGDISDSADLLLEIYRP